MYNRSEELWCGFIFIFVLYFPRVTKCNYLLKKTVRLPPYLDKHYTIAVIFTSVESYPATLIPEHPVLVCIISAILLSFIISLRQTCLCNWGVGVTRNLTRLVQYIIENFIHVGIIYILCLPLVIFVFKS